jgi:hypothetical protein
MEYVGNALVIVRYFSKPMETFQLGGPISNVTIVPREAKCGESAIGEVTLGAGGPH